MRIFLLIFLCFTSFVCAMEQISDDQEEIELYDSSTLFNKNNSVMCKIIKSDYQLELEKLREEKRGLLQAGKRWRKEKTELQIKVNKLRTIIRRDNQRQFIKFLFVCTSCNLLLFAVFNTIWAIYGSY